MRAPRGAGATLTNVGAAVLSAVIVVWTLVPIYNMVMVSLEAEGDVFSDHLWPPNPSVESFWIVLTQGYWYLEYFWHQFGNSVYIGVMVTFFVLLIGSLTSFSISRMRIRNGWLITNAALLTYVIPASFLAIPFYLIMQHYGLHNNPWSVIAALVTFATPYAIFIFQEYGRSIPLELDESARIDGASPLQIYFRIYLPLMAPALVAVGTYALLLAWNEYLYQFLLLSNKAQHDRAGGAGAVPQQRRGAVELHDGDRDHLCAAADRDLLRVPPPDVLRPDDGRRQGLTLAAQSRCRGRACWTVRRARAASSRRAGSPSGSREARGHRARRSSRVGRSPAAAPAWHRHLHGSELAWAIAFVVPYAAVFAAFVVYPVAYGLWMASEPSLYGELIADPLYARTVVNTALYVGLGVNVKMFLALLLSGFFMRRRWWIKALLPVFILPWALPAIPAFVSFHWMLIGEEGLVDSLLSALFGIRRAALVQ